MEFRKGLMKQLQRIITDLKPKPNNKKNGGGLSPVKAKELNNIMNASQGIAENLQKQSMVSRKRGGIINGNDLVSSYYE